MKYVILLLIISGCSSESTQYVSKDNLSYERDIKPIFRRHCFQCHSSGQLNWADYDASYKNKDKIKNRVWETRTMPPGMYISEKDRMIVRDWVDQGAKR